MPGLPVEVDIKTAAEVVRDTVNQDIEDHCGQHSLPLYERKEWLPLSAQPHGSLPLFGAYPFAEDRIFHQNADRKQIQLCILRHSHRAIGMVK